MSQETWNSVDRYIGDLFVGRDTALEAALEASAAAVCVDRRSAA